MVIENVSITCSLAVQIILTGANVRKSQIFWKEGSRKVTNLTLPDTIEPSRNICNNTVSSAFHNRARYSQLERQEKQYREHRNCKTVF